MTFKNVHPQKVDYLIPPLLCPPKMIESQTYRRKVCYVAVEVVVGAAKEAGEEMFNEVMDIVGEVENHAEVVEDSLEELLFRPTERVGRKVSRVVDPEDLGTIADEEDEDLT